MTVPTSTPTDAGQDDSRAGVPCLLAFAGGVIQLASVFIGFPLYDTLPFGISISAGVALSLGAIVFGHVVLGRIKRGAFSGRGLALFGVMVGYLSLPIGLVLYLLVSFAFHNMHDSM